MGGLVLAFKQFQIRKGILGSPWAGFKYFEQLFRSPYFFLLIRNTIALSIYSLIAGFPMPILLAVALNETRSKRFKKSVQMITYAPHFISTVVMVGIIYQFLDLHSGFVNQVITGLGGTSKDFIGNPRLFRSIYVWSGVWQNTGYGAIIYIAALTSIDPSLHESAFMDGASRFQKIIHIDIPGIAPTIVILLILNLGTVMSLGFEKVYLLQNPLNLSRSEIFPTYVYKVGLLGAQYSFSTAVSLFNSVINFLLIISVNFAAKRLSETSLW
jgi:putative aldouronate transport system permease protein